MTQIVNSGKASNPRGTDTWSDNLATNETTPASVKPLGKNRFVEHLEPNSSTFKNTARTPQTPVPMNNPDRAPVKGMSTPAKTDKGANSEFRGAWERGTPRDDARAPRIRPMTNADSRPTPNTPTSNRPIATKDSYTPDQKPDASNTSSQDAPDRALRPDATPKAASASPSPVRAAEGNPTPVAVAPSAGTMPTDTGMTTAPIVPSEAPVEDWQKRLQFMLASGSPELLMQQNPALALLAGRMEFVDPAQIPAIVAQSPLLQGILSAPQSSEALQTSMSMEQSLQLLGIMPPNTSFSAPAATATNPLVPVPEQAPVKLAEVLQSLGFDVPRLTQEGDLLKDNLGLDGLQSYMQRAGRMQTAQGAPIPIPIDSPLLPNPGLTAKPVIVPQQQQQQGLTPIFVDQNAQAHVFQAAQPRNEVHLWTQIPETNTLMPLHVVDDGTDDPTFLTQPELLLAGMDFTQPNARANSTTPQKPETAQQSLPPLTATALPTLFTAMPQANPMSQDPFLVMAQRWNPETIQTIRKEEMVWTDVTAKAPEQVSQQALQSLDDLLNRHIIQAPDSGIPLEATPAPREKLTLDTSALQFTLQDSNTSRDNQSGDFSQQNQGQFLSQDTSSLFTPTSQAPLGTQKSFSLQMGAPLQAPHQPMTQQNMQDIFDKSSMLIKDGGGSIRIDLGSRENGPLDLALDIRDKTVELRIITHSNQSRDALMQELPKLRESLLNQHLNLEKVEIGLSNSSAWSQSSGNGRQGQDRVFENWQENSSRGPGGIRSTSSSYRQSITQLPDERIPLHNGLIQVRV